MLICSKMLQVLLIICCCIANSLSHNIGIKVGPILKTHTALSYFGFSATGVVGSGKDIWVAVGSPKANTSRMNTGFPSPERNFDNSSTGALYRCPYTMDPSDCEDITVIHNRFRSFEPRDGWYGVTVTGGRLQDKDVMVCSHRPIVKHCTITGDCKDAMPGVCFTVGGHIIEAIQTVSQRQFEKRGLFYTGSRFGETGIGAAISQDQVFYSGAVGDFAFSGSISSLSSENLDPFRVTEEEYAYGGYSLATGSFFKPGSNDFAIGAPRYKLNGAVFLKDSLSEDPKVSLLGEQDLGYGSYFGMAVCAGDFDGDKIFEVVVGAPFFTDSINVPSSGKVYLYSSKNNFTSPVKTFRAPETQARALFGRAVAVIGDLNLDGFNDLAIGSPYQDDSGAIYIYHGSSESLSTSPVQTIKPSDFPNNLKTFGWSVRGETDLDTNGYPDIVVGAYASDSVMVLRSVPVVVVDVQYKLSSPTIDVSNKSCFIDDPVLNKKISTVCFVVEVVASYTDRAGEMKKPINISFNIDADTLVPDVADKRVRFESSQSPYLEIKNHRVDEGQMTPIVRAKAYLRVDLCPECDDLIEPFPDIQLKVTPELPTRPEPPTPSTSGTPPSLERYFQLPYAESTAEANFTETTIQVKRACSPCKPDLWIKNNGTTKIPVQAKNVLLKVMIGNKLDQAYGVTFTIDLPPPLKAQPCGEEDKCLYFKCDKKRNGSLLSCDLSAFKTNRVSEYKIKVDTSKASNSLETYTVLMNVTSKNKEDASLLEDNHLQLELQVASEADIEMRAEGTQSRYYGGSVRGQFSMTNEDQIGLQVNHTFSVYNNGPDRVPEVNITIDWPYQAKSGKHLLYLVNITGKDINNGRAKCFPAPNVVNPLASQFNKDDESRVRRDVDDDSNTDPAASSTEKQTPPNRKGSASRIILDCANGTARCVSIPCTVTNIGKSQKVDIKFVSRIWNGTLLEDYTDRDVIVVSRGRIDELTSYIEDANENNHEKETSTSFFPASPKTTKKDIEVWIIAVSAVAGVVLLVILVVVFKMCGFFNRSGAQRYDAVPEN
ncbi:integrin alpha-7-like [Dendronephthya gigantea]|uniref:integrin alpha-7-like n=1 Tax=Dendronephthya gigantea TaxID=151771 RepID=UPI00106D1074|nr:integrin alpha-7-like [Dendronephthya gigantea]